MNALPATRVRGSTSSTQSRTALRARTACATLSPTSLQVVVWACTRNEETPDALSAGASRVSTLLSALRFVFEQNDWPEGPGIIKPRATPWVPATPTGFAL